MSKYTPYVKTNFVFISKNYKKIFFGKRTVYVKKDKKSKITGYYVKYKNKYYRAFYGANRIWNVRIT